MHRRVWGVAVSLLLLGAVGTGRAADVPIVGTKLIAISKAGKAKVSFVAKDVAVTKGTGIVPDGSLAATLEITYDGVSGGFTMPAPSWHNGDVLAKYTNNAAPTGGSMKLSLIKPGLMLKASARSLGEVPLDISSAPTGAVYVADTIVNGTETNRLCTQFAGCVHRPIAAGTGYKLACRGNSTGDAACTAAGSAITDECAFDTDNCDANATCADTLASFTCTCNAGYSGDGVTCTDDDECTLDTDNCDANAACTNTPGSFSCACDAGYSGDGVTCTDDDECTLDTDNCDANATCTNTPGSFTCDCNAGYSGDGVTCTDDDECTLGTDNCDANATCTNTLGSFTCACNAGYSGDGVTCTDDDECTLGTDDCDANATCTNTPGSFTCTCNPGYTGDGTVCVPTLNCASANGLTWCFNPNACGEACNQVCAANGLSVVASDAVWFAAQDTVGECQAISVALGLGTSVNMASWTYACLEDEYGAHTAPGGLNPGLYCSTYSGCPANHRTQMDQLGIACGTGSRRSICPCE